MASTVAYAVINVNGVDNVVTTRSIQDASSMPTVISSQLLASGVGNGVTIKVRWRSSDGMMIDATGRSLIIQQR